MIAVFLYNMIWTSDKIQWCLFFYIWWYEHQTKFNNICFSASDDINIRKKSMKAVFRHLMILTSDKNSEVFVFLYLMILTSDKIQWYPFFCILWCYVSLKLNTMIAVFFFSLDDINIRQTSKICFSTSDDMNLRQNSMMSFSASDDINIRKNSMRSFFCIWWY